VSRSRSETRSLILESMRDERGLGAVPPSDMGAVVEVRDLVWRPFGRREPVLSGITLRVEAGSRVLLAGPSGSGKSTFLRALAGVLTTTETGDLTGTILVDGVPPADSSVGLMMQDPSDALVAGRVGRDVAFGPESYGMPRDEIWSRVRSALADVGFPYDEDHPTEALSGGETQRLALAGVLALTPRLVLLDEPTSMLDPSSAAVVRSAILSAVRASGATLVMVEHQLSDWVDQVDRVVVLDPGGTVNADGPVAETLAESADALAALGVWVPGVAPPRPLRVERWLCAPALSVAGPTPLADPDRDLDSHPRRDPASGLAASGRTAHARQTPLVVAESVSVTRWPRLSVMSGNRRSAKAVQALQDVSAHVSVGECVAVTGPSGAGKSTLTALLAGLEAPTDGRVRAGGSLFAGSSGGAGSVDRGKSPTAIHQWTSRSLAARFGWVPQRAEQAVVGRTVREDVLSTSRRLDLDDHQSGARVDALLEVLGLAALSGADPHHLSGGEQRRLALAGAIAHGPSVLVLDEPTIGQDRLTWAAVAGVVMAARDAGTAVVLATHDPLLIALADRQIILLAGRQTDIECQSPGSDRSSTMTPTSHFTGLAGRTGPLSLVLASLVLVFGAPFISDLPAALVGVGVEVALAPLVLGWSRPAWRRLLPGLLAVASVSFSNWLLSPGHEASAGALAGLRVAFFVVPGVLLASRIDPSALGDSLGQRLRLPARPVVAAVAALHRFEGLGEHWEQLARIRRVRGLGPGRSPLDRLRSVSALTFGLLVETLRQAGRMAVAMEARGFSSGVTVKGSVSPRTWAEPAPWRPSDWLMLGLALVVTGIPLLVSRL
jgi:energy-coupling factor transporter ATP-binding protein EcfA2